MEGFRRKTLPLGGLAGERMEGRRRPVVVFLPYFILCISDGGRLRGDGGDGWVVVWWVGGLRANCLSTADNASKPVTR